MQLERGLLASDRRTFKHFAKSPRRRFGRTNLCGRQPMLAWKRMLPLNGSGRSAVLWARRCRSFLLTPGSSLLYLSAMENPDQLRELFRMQKALNERIGVHTDGMNEEEKTKWLLNYTRAMQQEMAELTDSVPWKWWAKYQKFDEQNARVEVVDLFHFLISMAQVLGMSADDVFQAYVKKNEVNFKRQESGYTKKDEGDSKHI
jgi:dimeric dUTPase (all-alpha-NTP-PPase superfamily)